ncbi:MAG: 3-oxoacyl-ACP synthase [Bacteroidota bacterium]
MMNHANLKEKVFAHCWETVLQQEKGLLERQKQLRESLDSEQKSSAGDKHETGRAMVQLEQEKLGKQLHEISQLKQVLTRIDAEQSHQTVALGSLVRTQENIFFISISTQPYSNGGQKVLCISPASPLGRVLLGKTTGEVVPFLEKQHQILEIH